MEAELSLGCGQFQFLLHDLLAGVVRELEIVGAGHHTGQVVIRSVDGLLDDGQWRRERLETSDGKPGTARDKLEE